jgi:tRNA G10  N-methylase Trm11
MNPKIVLKKRSIAAGKADSDDRSAWLIRCRAGLGSVALDEMRFRKVISKRSSVFTLKQRDHDLILLAARVEHPPGAILRIPEQVLDCPAYGRYKISNAQIARLVAKLRSERKRFRLAATAAGTHFVRQDLARFLERELKKGGVQFSETAEDLLWVFCIDEAYYIGLERFDASNVTYRECRIVERPGSLPPTIAAAMAFLGVAYPQDVVFDPVCGSGTLLAEAHGYAPDASFIGIDADTVAINVAEKNLAHLPKHQLISGDGSRTTLAPGSVTLFLANLPFGKQFGEKQTNPDLYHRLLAEMVRLGNSSGWRAILLSSDIEALEAAFATHPELRCKRCLRVKVRGEWAQIVKVSQV